jgi:hypothetical protein
MKSAEFFKAFTAGKLGDDAEWFDWIFVYEAYNHRKPDYWRERI